MKHHPLYHWLPVLLLAGCTEGIEPSGATQENTLQVEAEIQPSTGRAIALADYDKRSFATGDKIIIKASDHSSTGYTYTRNAKGYWTSTTPCTLNSGVTFTGYYPSAEAVIASDQSTVQSFHDSNLLQTPEVAPATNLVRFTGTNAFAPQRTKITIIIRYSNPSTPVSATLTNTGSGLINSVSKETRCLYTTSTDLATATASQNWACILSPGTHTLGFAIVRTESGTDRTGTFTDQERTFETGKNYTYNFLSTSELILTEVAVTPFHDSGEEEAGSAT